MWGFLIAAFVVCVIILGILKYFEQAKCPECGKRNCAEQGRREVGSQRITIQKEEKINHYGKKQLAASQVDPLAKHSPESVSVRKYTVPGERVFYDVIYVCRECKTAFTRREQQDFEV